MKNGLLSTYAIGLLGCFITSPGFADDATAAFYKGRQVILYNAYAAGGTSALYGDILRRHIGRHIPGNPTVITRSMPGGAGLTVTNHMAMRAARDGSEFAMTSRTAPFEPLYGNDKATFNPVELSWIGSANVEVGVCIANADSNVDSFDMAKKHELIVGGSAPDALDTILPSMMNKLLGTKFKIVGGYPLSSDILLAMERKEVSGFCSVGWASLKTRYVNLLEEKKIKLIFQIADKRASDLPNLPVVRELVSDPEDKHVFDLLLAPQGMGRPFLAPPMLPPDRLATLRDAFAKTMADPLFITEAEKAGLDIEYVSGEAVEQLIKTAYATPKPLVERVKSLLGR